MTEYFDSRAWGLLGMNLQQIRYLDDLTRKLNAIEEDATATNTADDLDQGTYNRFDRLGNVAVARNTNGTVSTVTHTEIVGGATYLLQTYSYNSKGQISGCVSVDSSTTPSKTITETFTYTGDAITSIGITVA
tara:strand:- start:36 stop:434 length:399 start_codon:yes stop_codon:yes gene_type:complete